MFLLWAGSNGFFKGGETPFSDPFLPPMPKYIPKIPKVSCKTCVSYNPEYHRCERFKTKNIVTGIVVYDYIGLCREDETKCGEYGRYYIEKVVDS